jgi:hypothetical protein
MKTFNQFMAEAKLRMLSVGPSRSPYGIRRQQDYNSERAAFKKAGVRRTRSGGNRARFNAFPSSSGYTSTAITTFPNQSSYEKDVLKPKVENGKKVTPTSQRVLQLRKLKKQLGNRSNRQVHNVDILPKKDYKKNDPRELISRGKSYHDEIKSVPEKIKSAGGKPGDKFVGKAMEVMPGSTDVKKGRKKRERVYSKVLGMTKRDPITNVQTGTVK